MQIKLSAESLSGTSLYGEIITSYKNIVNAIGEPNAQDDKSKVDASWAIEIDGVFLTIYNYKDGKNYLGSRGLPISKLTDWHIGAHYPRNEKHLVAAQFLAEKIGGEFIKI